MTHDPVDADLQARFAALREHDQTFAPHFGATLARARARPPAARRPPAWRGVAAGGLLAAVLAGPWVLRPTQPPIEPGPGATLAWRAPTDGLLASTAVQVQHLDWNSLPTTALGRPSFNQLPEPR